MSAQDNKLLDRRFYQEVVNPGNIEMVGEFFATHIEFMQQLISTLHQAFTGLHFTIEEQISEGDKLVTRWTATGTHTGQWKIFAPTNRSVKWTGTTTQRYFKGKVVALRTEADCLGLYKQLGLKVAPNLSVE